MRIQIDYDVSDEAVARVQQLLDDTALRDVDFNGAEFSIERGDCTMVVDDGKYDQYDTLRLFQAVQAAIAGETGAPDGYRKISSGEAFRA